MSFALIMRTAMILGGVLPRERIDWVIHIFGALQIVTRLRMAFEVHGIVRRTLNHRCLQDQ